MQLVLQNQQSIKRGNDDEGTATTYPEEEDTHPEDMDILTDYRNSYKVISESPLGDRYEGARRDFLTENRSDERRKEVYERQTVQLFSLRIFVKNNEQFNVWMIRPCVFDMMSLSVVVTAASTRLQLKECGNAVEEREEREESDERAMRERRERGEREEREREIGG